MKKDNRPIVLIAQTKPAQQSCHISLTPEARNVLMRLQRLTGRTARSLASEILLKAESLIKVQYDFDLVLDEDADEEEEV